MAVVESCVLAVRVGPRLTYLTNRFDYIETDQNQFTPISNECIDYDDEMNLIFQRTFQVLGSGVDDEQVKFVAGVNANFLGLHYCWVDDGVDAPLWFSQTLRHLCSTD